MKVIFLDNDGVICLSNNWGSRYKKARKYMMANGIAEHNQSMINEVTRPVSIRLDNFDIKAIEILNAVLDQTGAEIVVSSDWRFHATLEELGEYYESQGIIKKPIAVTDRILYKTYEDFPWNRKFDLEQTRSLEILEWLATRDDITHWVAIDDLDMSLRNDWGLTNFVHTPKSNEGIKQSGVKGKLLKFLV
jgi:hypothetical protein